jgi:hypothetical protein
MAAACGFGGKNNSSPHLRNSSAAITFRSQNYHLVKADGLNLYPSVVCTTPAGRDNFTGLTDHGFVRQQKASGIKHPEKHRAIGFADGQIEHVG